MPEDDFLKPDHGCPHAGSSTSPHTLQASDSRENSIIGETPLPELNRLMALRDALVALKGPLADLPGLRQMIEQVLFNNDVSERILGKRVSMPLPCQPNCADGEARARSNALDAKVAVKR